MESISSDNDEDDNNVERELLADVARSLALAKDALSFDKIFARDVERRMEHVSETERRATLEELAHRLLLNKK